MRIPARNQNRVGLGSSALREVATVRFALRHTSARRKTGSQSPALWDSGAQVVKVIVPHAILGITANFQQQRPLRPKIFVLLEVTVRQPLDLSRAQLANTTISRERRLLLVARVVPPVITVCRKQSITKRIYALLVTGVLARRNIQCSIPAHQAHIMTRQALTPKIRVQNAGQGIIVRVEPHRTMQLSVLLELFVRLELVLLASVLQVHIKIHKAQRCKLTARTALLAITARVDLVRHRCAQPGLFQQPVAIQ